MSVYKCLSLADILSANTYPGRGIVVGMSEDKKYSRDVCTDIWNG